MSLLSRLIAYTALITAGAILTTSIDAATAIPTAKTFYKLPNAAPWQTSENLPFLAPSTSNGTIQTAIGIEGFYWHSLAKDKLGSYFGFYDTATAAIYPFITVFASNPSGPFPAWSQGTEQSLFPQDIIHDSAHATAYASPTTGSINPLTGKIAFAPWIEQYGFTMINSVLIDNWISIHTIIPWVHTNQVLGLTVSNTNTITVESTQVGIADFFSGAVTQSAPASANQQDPLHYGMLRDSQSAQGAADITLVFLCKPDVGEDLDFHVGGLMTFPTTSRASGKYLFEPILGTGSHVMFGLHARGHITIAQFYGITLSAAASATGQLGVAAEEIRSPSYLIEGQDAQWGRYALAGKLNARRLFPLINLLTQPVTVQPGKTADITAHLDAAYKRATLSAEYRFQYTGAEKVTPVLAWQAGVYALSTLSYAQTSVSGSTTTYTPFSLTTHSAFGSGVSLQANNINYLAATTPSQSTHTIAGSFRLIPLARFPYSALTLRAFYTFTIPGVFGISGYGFSGTLSHRF